MGGRLLA